MKKVLTAFAVMGSLVTASSAWAIDPNCAVNVGVNGAINNYFGAPNNNQTRDATNVIAQLDFADLYRQPPFRINGNLVRLDAQGLNGAGDSNWQVQINGVNGNSTIAHAQIVAAVGNASTADRQRNVERSARNALNQSLNTGNRYDVTGHCD